MKNGFTLIEVLIYLGILSLIVVALLSFDVSVISSRSKTMVVEEVQANARIALDLVSQKIRGAQGINVGASVFGSDPGVLSLAMANATQNPTVFNLSADDGRLQITEGSSGTPVFVTSKDVEVTNLVFTNYSQPGEREHIRIDITVRYKNAGSVDYSYSYSAHTSVSVRQ